MSKSLIEDLIDIDSEYLNRTENIIEKQLSTFLSILSITAIKKIKRKTLKYNYEIISSIFHAFYLSDMDNVKDLYREITKKLLNDNIINLTFYIHISFDDNKITYHFRYLPKQLNDYHKLSSIY